MVTAHGSQVTESASGEETVCLLRDEAMECDLLVIDENFEDVTRCDAAARIAHATPCMLFPLQGCPPYAHRVSLLPVLYPPCRRDAEKPLMTGSMATRLLREAGLTLPIIACTGNANYMDQDFYTAHGASALWSKPLPSWRDGSMQRSLAQVLTAHPKREPKDV